MTNHSHRVHVCGLSEIKEFQNYPIEFVFSLLDEEDPDPELSVFPKMIGHRRVNLSDVIQEQGGISGNEHITNVIQPSRELLEESFLWILEKFRNHHEVLVHCYGGISRSTAVTISLLYDRLEDPVLAWDYLKEIRPIALPNTLVIGIISEIMGWGDDLIHHVSDVRKQAEEDYFQNILHHFKTK